MVARSLERLEVVSGQPLRITLAASGVPPPRCRWRFNGAPLLDGRFEGSTVRSGGSTLHIDSCVRAHSGTYTAVCANGAGEVKWEEAFVAVRP